MKKLILSASLLFLTLTSYSQDCLSNADILKMHQAGFSKELIVLKIEHSPKTCFDVSTEAIVELKKLAVSEAVIKQMICNCEPVIQGNRSISKPKKTRGRSSRI